MRLHNLFEDDIKKELDMSLAGRMNRASEMGFDTNTIYYHGTTATGLESISKSGFRNSVSGVMGSGIYFSPSKHYAANSYGSRFHNYTKGTLPDIGRMIGKYKYLVVPVYIKRGGIVEIKFKGKEVLVVDGTMVRSVHATFDPDFSDSAMLLV